jgi:hypothetical protein
MGGVLEIERLKAEKKARSVSEKSGRVRCRLLLQAVV